MHLQQSLKIIESYKQESPHYVDLLDILGGILVLREDFSRGLTEDIFPVDDKYILPKISGGMPLVDSSQEVNLAPAENYLRILVEALGEKFGGEALILKKHLQEEQSYRDLLIAYQLIGADCHGGDETRAEATIDSLETDIGEEAVDIVGMLLRESLRPGFERVINRYSQHLNKTPWHEGFCPVCGSEPKIGEIKGEEGHRHLYCHQCGYEWVFPRIMCPFCGNDDHQSLLYFTVEGNENYRVDTCSKCRQYIKIVDMRSMAKEVNLEIEDINTLHLDIIAADEGYE
ncbi:MAG: formate dehydrogenase accessory protein FdhE [Deltaproteobacteria bacterium]|nr:formate dehydrogenase accessory protein FdhE [Deltaproteobacteria bacterium]